MRKINVFIFVRGIIVPGGFGERGFQGMIEACRWSRENNVPFLGICLGLQSAVVEFARNVLNIADAHSLEMNSNSDNLVIIDMPEHNTGQMGGTLRLGLRETFFKKDCILSKLLSRVLFISRSSTKFFRNFRKTVSKRCH